jgi:phosphomannomutase
MLRGDELGTIFGYYLATNQSNSGRTFANSIVSSSALAKIAEKYQITFARTLTGFKWLAKVANLSYGYEEAIGYNVAPSITNDKDGITAAVKIAEIASVLKSEDQNFFDYLDQIWKEIGYHRTEQISIRVSELSRITEILNKLRQDPPAKIAGLIVKKIDDLLKPTDGLLPTDGLRFWLEENVRVIIRPSGTEPKVKCYIELVRPTPSKSEKIFAEELVKALRVDLSKVLS